LNKNINCIMLILKNLYFDSDNPLPNLPPRGKEEYLKPFPLGGNGKGGVYLKNYCFIPDCI
jgi:hypothetical protein